MKPDRPPANNISLSFIIGVVSLEAKVIAIIIDKDNQLNYAIKLFNS